MMAWYAVYDDDTGFLRSQGSREPVGLEPGMSYKTYPERPTDLWDETARDFTIPYKERKTLTAVDFMRRFTPEERKAIRAAEKVDEDVEDVFDLLRVATELRATTQDVQDGLMLLVYKGLITQARADEIGDF